EMAPPPRPRRIDPYLPSLRERWNAGEHNARGLWREIRAPGYRAGEEQVRRVVNAWRADPHHHRNQPSIAAPPAKEEVTASSARKTRWLLCKPTADLTSAEARYVAALTALCPQIADAQRWLGTFRTMVTERCIDAASTNWIPGGNRASAPASQRSLG